MCVLYEGFGSIGFVTMVQPFPMVLIQVVERINDNAYKLDLPGESGVGTSFNVTDLSPFDVGDDLKANPSQVGENDANQGAGHANHARGNEAKVAQDPLSLPSIPITRLGAKRFDKALNGLI
jgi:hypothetical protein